jgi:alkylated DNA repair protein (DNA oxidative demethylase)
VLDGFRYHPQVLTRAEQAALVAEVMAAAEVAPFFQPMTPGGKAMSVRMTSLGPLGWMTDRAGYRYQATHPQTGSPWPAMPQALRDLWTRFAPGAPEPDACLANLYRDGAKMGLHQDKDEADFSAPVLSLSLGDTAVFRLGGRMRGDPTTTLRLTSGDLCILGGGARLAIHGVDRVLQGSSTVIPGGGRLNLTLRRAR